MLYHTDKSSEILSPKEFVEYALGSKISLFKDVKTAILCYDSHLFINYILNIIKGEIINKLTGRILINKNIAFGGNFGIGAPAAGAFMEELIACGIRKFICLGSAGSLVNEVSIGDVVICAKAISNEGTSSHYIPGTTITFPSGNLNDSIYSNLKLNTKIYQTTSWTTDAAYRETKAKVEYYKQLGAKVVEMEASALNTVAKYRNVEVAHIFVVGDSLAKGKWQSDFNSDRVGKLTKRILMQIIDIIANEQFNS